MKCLFRALAAFAIVLAYADVALAQGWPNRPIRMVVPYTPGGYTDLMARLVGQKISEALGRPVTYVDVPFEQWRDQELRPRGLPEHVYEHLLTMAKLHAANRYDRLTHDVEAITGRPANSVRDFVARNAELFDPRASGDR